MIRIGIIIPDRGDRPAFLANCLRMMRGQTLQPVGIALMNFAPRSADKDITVRYREGYDFWKGDTCDVIALIENDDYYAPDYLEKMAAAWDEAGRPDIFGTDRTIYYNLNERAWKVMLHSRRSSAMSTFIKPNLPLTWPVDSDPYTDIHLWKTVKGCTRTFDPPICIGIKHGVGLCGGRMHVDHLERLEYKDPNMAQLWAWMDSESFKFYSCATLK
jgi:glycosyltransferase involved in cell wall biosynthesis